jgi:hypothetical protein
MRRAIRVGLKIAAIMVTAAVVAGVMYERVGCRQDRRYPRVGRAVEIGGRSMNIDCAGQGSPTVIFESGAESPGYGWLPIQPQVAKFTHG